MTRILAVRVKPNAKASELRALADGMWYAALRAPPADGKANAELIALIAAHFHCTRARVTIRSGAGSRHKRVAVDI